MVFWQIESSTINVNVEFVYSEYSCILTVTIVNSCMSDKIIINSDNFRVKCFSSCKISEMLCVPIA